MSRCDGAGHPLILAFDTSTARCAAALVAGDIVLASRDEPMERGQAERLLPLLEDLLADAGQRWDALAAVAVCTGPGNFTGLRIAVAAARGLALALGVPALGVTRFEALAHDRPGRLVIALDARRGALYAQSFEDGAPLAPPALIPPEALQSGGLRLGAAAPVGSPEAAEAPDPAAIARVAAARLGTNQPRPAPLYLRPPDADRATEAPPLILDDA